MGSYTEDGRRSLEVANEAFAEGVITRGQYVAILQIATYIETARPDLLWGWKVQARRRGNSTVIAFTDYPFESPSLVHIDTVENGDTMGTFATFKNKEGKPVTYDTAEELAWYLPATKALRDPEHDTVILAEKPSGVELN